MSFAGSIDSPLLERTGELARIESALIRARDGHGSFLVIEGPAGIGKTALLAATRAAAEEDGMRSLRSRGAELERDFAFGVVRQLFEPPLAEAPDTERADVLQGAAGLAGDLLRLPGAGTENGSGVAPGSDLSFAVLHGLYWLCANLSSTRPLCLVVDDAHWADAPSLRYLAFLLPRLEELCVALVVAARPREAGTETDLLATLTTDPLAEVIRLAPLTRGAVGELVEVELGARPDPEFVDACLRATRGTPFLVRELVGAMREDGIAPNAGSASHVERIGARTVGRSILLRLRRLPEPAGRLARAAAILEQGDLHQAAKLAQLEHDAAAEAADLLGAAGILEFGRPLTFVHPIVRTSIYSELSSYERAQGHRGAARLLADQPGATERVAEHLLVSDPNEDGWVVEQLVEAGRAAARSGAPESSAAYLRRALEEPPAPEERAGLLLELGMAEASAGLPEWRAHLQAAVDGATDDPARVAAAMVLALALSREQRSTEAVEILDRAASLLDPAREDLRILLEAAAVGGGMINDETAPALARRRQAARDRAAADPSAPPELLAVAAFIAVLANEPAEVAADLATRALQAERDALRERSRRPWFSYATWFSQVTVSLLWAERYEQVRPLLLDRPSAGDGGQRPPGRRSRASWLARSSPG